MIQTIKPSLGWVLYLPYNNFDAISLEILDCDGDTQ